jgi:hypothetical protein
MAKKTEVKVPEVVETGELALAAAEGSALERFVGGLRVFFSEALVLEQAARQTLGRAKQWKAPTTKEEDQVLVDRVRQANRDKAQIEEHWQITRLVHQFHGRLTKARDRGIKTIEEAVAIGTRLHTTYAEAERRRAREEEDRLRREADERARAAREKELADLERKAIAAEEASQDLSERERRFLAEWFRNGGNGVAAARDAGYRDPVGTATRLLGGEKIRAAIEAQRSANVLASQLEAKRAAPVESKHVRVAAEVATGDASRWSGEVLDEVAFIAAIIGGKHGIPWDVLTVNQVKLNDYARGMHEQLDRWPGVRATKKTSIR